MYFLTRYVRNDIRFKIQLKLFLDVSISNLIGIKKWQYFLVGIYKTKNCMSGVFKTTYVRKIVTRSKY